jgi:abequosyltransferase
MQTDHSITKQRPLLTLAIPTCNRATYLRQLLDSVSEQLRAESRVELLISDNASTDATPSLVEGEIRNDVFVTYIRNETNVGPDANFLQCYERARGKYVWIIGDDDIIAQGAIERILGYLSRDEYDLIYLGAFGFRGLEVQPKAHAAAAPNATMFSDARSLLRRMNLNSTLISVNIVNKDRVEASGHSSFSTLIGSNLIQVGWIYTALRAHRKSLLVEEKLVGYRFDNTGGYRACELFGPTLSRVASEWLQDPDLVRMVLNGSIQRFFPTYLSKAKRGARQSFEQEDAHLILSRVFSHNLRYWLFNYPLIVLPGGLGWCWLQGLKVVNRIDRACGYPSLSW